MIKCLAALLLCSAFAQELSFAPIYPKSQLTRELDSIARIIASKKANKDLDHSIRYAVYNFASDWKDLWEAMIGARDAGVRVQVLVDEKQIGRDYNHGIKKLQDAGFRWFPSQKNMTEEELESAELVGVTTDGIMHLKTRIFRAPDYTELYTGSFNPELGEGTGVDCPNNDTLISFMNPDDWLLEKYDDKIDATLRDASVVNEWFDGEEFNVIFSPDEGLQAIDKILEFMEAEQELILIDVFTLRNVMSYALNTTLLETLSRAKGRGVKIVVVTDANMNDARFTSDLRALQIPVFTCNNTVGMFHAMHNKNSVIGLGRPVVSTGSCNWSGSAMGSKYKAKAVNVEDTMFISERRDLAHAYMSDILGVLRDYEGQQDPEATPSYGEVVADLSSIGGWSPVDVEFVVDAGGDAVGVRVLAGGGRTVDLTRGATGAFEGTATFPFGAVVSAAYRVEGRDGDVWMLDASTTAVADPLYPTQHNAGVEIVSTDVDSMAIRVSVAAEM